MIDRSSDRQVFISKKSQDVLKSTVVPGGGSPGLFDVACNHLKDTTQARCAAVIEIDGESGSGYSVVGPIEAQVELPDILEQIANALRQQIVKKLQ